MRCEKVRQHSTRYLEDDLRRSLVGQIDRHLETCRSCCDWYREEKNLLAAFEESPDFSSVSAPDDLFQKIQSAQEKLPAPLWYDRFSPPVRGGLLIAGASFGVLLFLVVQGIGQDEELDESSLSTAALKNGKASSDAALLDERGRGNGRAEPTQQVLSVARQASKLSSVIRFEMAAADLVLEGTAPMPASGAGFDTGAYLIEIANKNIESAKGF